MTGSTSLRPTPAALAPLVAAGVLLLLSRVTGGGWLSLGAGAALALPLVALLLRPRLDGAVVHLSADRAPVGATAVLHVTVEAGERPLPPARLVLDDGLLGGCSVAVPALPAGATTSGSVAVPALRRGTADGVPVRLEATSPFGLLRAVRTVPARGRVVVHPASAPARPPAAAGEGASSATPVAGAGTEVLGLRPWRAGDAVHALHARATARHGRPVVLERERDAGTRTVLLVGALGTGPAWEDAVSRAAGLCLQVLRTGGELVLVGGAPAPRPSPASVLDWLAGLEAAGPSSPADVARAVRAAGTGPVVVLGAPPPGLKTAVAL